MQRSLLFSVLILSIAGIGVGLFFVFASYPLVSPLRAEGVRELSESHVNAESRKLLQGEERIGPRLRVDAVQVPMITAERAVIVDGNTGAILYGKEERVMTPIASLTKLMTALVVLERNPDWDREVRVTAHDDREGGTLFVRRDDVVTVRDLFFASLVGSANNATVALARSTDLSSEDFIYEMNTMAHRLGLADTVFVEPTGLDPENRSTAQDIARLAWHAFQRELIREAVTMPEYVFRTRNTGRRHRVKNTDILLKTNGRSYTIVGGKTGYIHESGFCLVIEAERDGKRVIALVLGSKSQEDRFTDVDVLIKWAFDSYQWL